MENGPDGRNEDVMFQGLLQVFRDQLPRIVDILAPEIIELLKERIDSNNVGLPISNSMSDELKAEFETFRNNNRTYIEEQLAEREDKYYTLARYEHYLDLWGECLEEEPEPYVPKKYRNDRFYVTSNAELISVNRSELQRFQSQCEIFRLRRDNITAEIFAIDKAISDLVTRSGLSPAVSEKAIERWNKLITEDKARVDAKWKKKIAGVRESYIKDQEYVLSNPRIRTNNSRSHQQQQQQQQQRQQQQQQLQFHSKRTNTNGPVAPLNQGVPTINNYRFATPTFPIIPAIVTATPTAPVSQAAAHFSSPPLQHPPPFIAGPGGIPALPPTTEEDNGSSTSASTATGSYTESAPITVISNNTNPTSTASGGARSRTDDASKNGRGHNLSYNLRS